MKAFRRTTALGLIVCVSSFFFSGCISNQQRKEQQKWVKLLQEEFEDDEFEYIGADYDGLIGQDKNVALVRSKKYPKESIHIRNTDGELSTNYNYVRYHEDVEEYIEEYLGDYFEGDFMEVEYEGQKGNTPIEDISLKKFIKKYVVFSRVKLTLVCEDGVFPSDEEMAEKLIDIAKDRGEACNITVYCCTKKPTNPQTECECYYTLTMNKEDLIYSITVASDGGKQRSDLVKDMSL